MLLSNVDRKLIRTTTFIFIQNIYNSYSSTYYQYNCSSGSMKYCGKLASKKNACFTFLDFFVSNSKLQFHIRFICNSSLKNSNCMMTLCSMIILFQLKDPENLMAGSITIIITLFSHNGMISR